MQFRPALVADNLSKKFCRNLKRSFVYGALDIANELTGASSVKLRKNEFWALKDISFTLKRGEALGLIGTNGSGKTTLLKILSGIIKPTEGHVEINGRVAPLIALGAGFNPVLTGRENIYVNLALLGLSKRSIEANLEQILDFAEIGDAIDAPLRTYSSGMSARLGFACAIHTDPQILFVDEVLAVGDARFRAKCYQRLAKLRESGTSLILVSHSAGAILNACETSLYLRSGSIMYSGETSQALRIYQEDQDSLDSNLFAGADLENGQAVKIDKHKIVDVGFLDANGLSTDVVQSGLDARFSVTFASEESFEELSLLVMIREQNTGAFDSLNLDSARDGVFIRHKPGRTTITLVMPKLGLKHGRFIAKVAIRAGRHMDILDIVEGYRFKSSADLTIGTSSFNQAREWQSCQVSTGLKS